MVFLEISEQRRGAAEDHRLVLAVGVNLRTIGGCVASKRSGVGCRETLANKMVVRGF